MSELIFVGAVFAVLLVAAAFLLLRTLSLTSLSHSQSFDGSGLSWRDYPLKRLLNPADFEFLRRSGVPEARIRQLRRERRRIYRLCLRSLAADFNRILQMLKLALVQSSNDRPDLAAELVRQKLMFYRNLFIAETAVMLHVCGVDRMPAMDLLAPLAALQDAMRQLAPSAALAGASA
jgi:hypothetical protein